MPTFTNALQTFSSTSVGTLSNTSGLNVIQIDIAFQTQMDAINASILQVQQSNLGETEKLFRLQLLTNNYTTIGQARTSMLKAHNDMMKAIGRNVT